MIEDKDEDTRWKEAWEKLNDKCDDGKMARVQHNAVVKVWFELGKAVEGLRRPAFGPIDDKYYFTWAYKDVANTAASVYVEKDGSYKWYFANSELEKCLVGDGDITALLNAISEPMKVFGIK